MIRLCFFALIIVYASALERYDTKIKAVDDKTNFQALNPDVKLIPFKKKIKAFGRILYSIGTHEEDDYDAFVSGSGMRANGKVDAEGALFYPSKTLKDPARITHIEVAVIQDSNDGQAYLVEGGPGAKNATVLIQAKQITIFKYKAKFYVPM